MLKNNVHYVERSLDYYATAARRPIGTFKYFFLLFDTTKLSCFRDVIIDKIFNCLKAKGRFTRFVVFFISHMKLMW